MKLLSPSGEKAKTDQRLTKAYRLLAEGAEAPGEFWQEAVSKIYRAR